MKALVTGVSSGLGNYLINAMNDSGEYDQIVGISRKYRYKYEDHPMRDKLGFLDCYGDLRLNCSRLVSMYKPDEIWHLAGDGRNNGPAKEVWEANVNTTFNLLEACKNLSVKFIHISSIVTELYPMSLYGAAKLSAEHLVTAYSNRNEGIKGTSFKLCALAGARNKRGLVRDVFDKYMQPGDYVEVYGVWPGSTKPFLYTGQVVKELLKDVKVAGHLPYYYCAPDSISVYDVCKIVSELTGREKVINFNPEKVWKDDHNMIYGQTTYNKFFSSRQAIELAVDDILKENYHV